MTAPRGVLTLAHDRTIDWLVAFCESLREREPELPLTVIPYDHRVAGLRRMAGRYRFVLLADRSLAELDALGRRIAHRPGQAPMFRKLAAFWGPYERFLYVDADCIVGAPLDPLFAGLEHSGADLLPTDFHMLGEVYLPGPLLEAASADPATGFGAGSFAGRRGALTLDRVLEIGTEAERVREGFASTGDQPFMNFCASRAGLRVARLEDAVPEVAPTTWGGYPSAESGGLVRAADPTWFTYGRLQPIVHWAGFRPVAGMPNGRLWLPYRLRPLPRARRAAYRVLKWWLPGLFWRTASAVARRLRRARDRSYQR